MAKFDREKEFFVALDLDRDESRPGVIIGIYYSDWESGRAVLEGWRGPKLNSEDFARTRLRPYPCPNLIVDIGGYFDCLHGTVI